MQIKVAFFKNFRQLNFVHLMNDVLRQYQGIDLISRIITTLIFWRAFSFESFENSDSPYLDFGVTSSASKNSSKESESVFEALSDIFLFKSNLANVSRKMFSFLLFLKL